MVTVLPPTGISIFLTLNIIFVYKINYKKKRNVYNSIINVVFLISEGN